MRHAALQFVVARPAQSGPRAIREPACAHRVRSRPRASGQLILECRNAVCDDGMPLYSYVSEALMRSAVMELRDEQLPQVSEVAGGMSGDAPVYGPSELTYRAADAGGGVYRHFLLIDGKEVLRGLV